MAWVIAGDFNEPLLDDDKFGGRAISINRSLLFKDCLDKCNMIDLGFSGPRFTWTNGRELSALIQERIDRFFVNPSWCSFFPEARVSHLTRCHSDHCPVLLETEPHSYLRLPRPFKFQSCWLSDHSFPRIVSGAWNHSHSLQGAINTFSAEAKRWNKEHFGNVFVKKRKIMARLNGLQRAIAAMPSSNLLELEKHLQKELESILDQERDIWALKSRINWMILGDRNTSFYHISTLVRRKRNQITAIKNSVGDWLYEERDVMEYIRKGFEDLFSSSLIYSERYSPIASQWQGTLSEEDCEALNREVTEEEIKGALWSMKPFKAPGPDGLHAGFYQRFWLVVGKSVVEEIKNIFSKKKILDYLNRTLVALIPKIQGPETLGNYRPISLCNTVYKIVTKIIVARLRNHLDQLISPLQTAFIPGRKGVDNAIIVQELIHSISRSKGKEGFMAIKIDLEKAYDKLEWSFIRERLVSINLPMDMAALIMSCISIVSTSVLVNGGMLEPIQPSRGIRQGDPLSPYIFILCIEFLGQLIEEKVSKKLWNPVKASRNGPSFSHLFFADDLVLFAKANQTNCKTIREVMDSFCSKSGQSISESKSRVYFSPNVDMASREDMCNLLGFRSTPSLGKYLGIPIKHPGPSNHDFNFVLDRVKQKLAGWKANLLSMAGRTTLIQASLSTIPTYTMQRAYLPSKVLER